MAQGTPTPTTNTFNESNESPRIGIGILPNDDSDALLHTALRARSNDLIVYIISSSIDNEIINLLWNLNITVLETSSGTQDRNYQIFVDAAREDDCDGLILCEAGMGIDFAASRQRIEDADAFSVDAVSAEPEATTGRLVGIPAYNESVGIGSTVLAAQQFADEVVVIDEGSADNTVEIVDGTDATLLEHGTNKGKGQALRTFFEYARDSTHESFVVLDGDGQHLPEDIPAVVKPIENGEADLVVGSRYLENGTDDETPFHRRVGQQVLDYLTFGSSGTKLSDTQSGFRAFSREAIETLSIRTDGMGVESEMIATAQDSIHHKKQWVSIFRAGFAALSFISVHSFGCTIS
ncbi:glycosyltransferase family 2 protein [Natronococcus wangiae]|uniref:glycosyltransferase family 2 protein n=1 Tax=Natronococcus wangiae TaxID=3068275 RepID=UPI00273D8DBC|nr:glycosyltransferase family 2 protein [Natronococcus sp. AD5]